MENVKKIGKKIWDNKRLLFVFVFSFLVYEFIAFPINNGDPINMYYFSHAIRVGAVPYRDFSMILTPFYSFLMSFGLFFFDDFLIFILENCLLVTILFYFLFKLLDKKAWIVLLGMSVTKFFGFLPTYNLLCFLFIVILVYLEKEYPDKDYLSGLILGLSILTKHTVGIFFVLVMIFIHYKNIKKIFRRLFSMFIPMFIFLTYLLVNDALYDFVNLTILGLFDFGYNNSNFGGIWFWFSIILFVFIIFIMIKRRDIYNYYFICSFIICVPLFDFPHFAMYLNCVITFFLMYINIQSNYIFKLCIGINALYSVLHFLCIVSLGTTFFKNLNHFNYMYGFSTDYKNDLKVNAFLDEYSNKNMVFLSKYTMFYDITMDREINFFSVVLYGNHGYDGTNAFIERLENLDDAYVIVDFGMYEHSTKESQVDRDVIEHIVNNYEMVDSKYCFQVYYKP